MIGNVSERLSKLDDYIMRLEEEMKKIDAFKRELPLCMLLLNDSILKLKEETIHCTRSSYVHPVMEEFIPIMRNSDETSGVKKDKDARDKKNWMSSAQLWSSNEFSKINTSQDEKQKSVDVRERAEEDDFSAPENAFPVCKYKNGGGAFLPFKGLSGFPVAMTKTRKEETEVQPTPSLSLSTPGGVETTNAEQNSGILNPRTGSGCRNLPSVSTTNVQSNLQTGAQPQQPPRKQRRCWSPDLHRRFVSALQQLGGSQVATPKQIRELMKVDGLTNDEVKSHLQKYRLHTRRHPTASSTTANQQPVVVLGGLWVSSQDQYGTSKSSTSQSESPQGPLQLAGAGGGISTTGGDSMEDEEDGRSESYSWKGHHNKPGETDP
ncbi:SANT/Myb domain [Macleaya cordata]|uniref:SANT/Myb domain n=1 Tax=Macleaya cordata TaxID=56857 RepID=A0A200QJ98_MACCD|nr:SANT/Myb domain [Macleaya cordata]